MSETDTTASKASLASEINSKGDIAKTTWLEYWRNGHLIVQELRQQKALARQRSQLTRQIIYKLTTGLSFFIWKITSFLYFQHEMSLKSQLEKPRQALIDVAKAREEWDTNYARLNTEIVDALAQIAHLNAVKDSLPFNAYMARREIKMALAELKFILKNVYDELQRFVEIHARYGFVDLFINDQDADVFLELANDDFNRCEDLIQHTINDHIRIQKYLTKLAADRMTLAEGGIITVPLICAYIGQGDHTALSEERVGILREKYGCIVIPLQELRECHLPEDITAIFNKYIKLTYPESREGQVKISKVKMIGHGANESSSISIPTFEKDNIIIHFELSNLQIGKILAYMVNSPLIIDNPEIVLLFCQTLDSNKYSSATSAAPADPNLLLAENCMVKQIMDEMLAAGLRKRVRIKGSYSNGAGSRGIMLPASNNFSDKNAAKFVTQLYYQDNRWRYTTYSMAEYRRLKHSNKLPLGEIAPETISTLDPVAMPALESAHITSESTIAMPLSLAVIDDQNANDDCHNPLESLAYVAIAGFVAYSIAEAVTLGAFDYQLSVSILAHSLGSANIIGTGILPFLCISLATAAAIGITYSFVDYISQPPPIACHNR